MAIATVKGIYRAQDGTIQLDERPEGVADATPVIVTFLPVESGPDSEADQPSEEARREAAQRLFALLKEGIPFGGPPYPKREELYDRVHRFGRKDDC
jgi:hypothetical protein